MAALILLLPILGLLIATFGTGVLVGTLIGPKDTIGYIAGGVCLTIGGVLVVTLWV